MAVWVEGFARGLIGVEEFFGVSGPGQNWYLRPPASEALESNDKSLQLLLHFF